jgi:serine protease Do
MTGWPMRRVFLILCLLAGSPAVAGEQPPRPISDLVATLLPRVVNITVIRQEKPPAAAHAKVAESGSLVSKRFYGSGFIVDPDGLIITNRHVVEGAREIMVFLNDNTRLRATVLYTPRIDMAILRVHYEKLLPAIKWGNSEAVRPGDPVIAIGNPLGIGVTVTAGIVSALDRDIHETQYDSFIQTDAAINAGNSGGPLFNEAGEVVGINTAFYSPGGADTGSVGLGFAIPSNDAQFVLKEWREYGRVRPGWIGVTGQPVTPDIADAAGLAPPRGVIVAAVQEGSPGAAANIEQGDIVLKVGDEGIDAVRTLNRAIAMAPLGKAVAIALWRNGAPVTTQAVVIENPATATTASAVAPAPAAPRPAPLDADDVGVRLSPITEALRKQYHIAAGQGGLVITEVVPNSIAANHGLQRGDVIVRFEDKPVTSTANLEALVKAAQQARQLHALVLLQDRSGPRWVGMPLFHEP